MGRSLQRSRQEVINIRTEPMARGRITGRRVSRCRRKSRKKHQGDFQLSNQVVGDQLGEVKNPNKLRLGMALIRHSRWNLFGH